MDEETAVLQIGTLNDLPPQTEGVVLLRAVKSEPEMDSQPQSNASSQSMRQPLQPVNRQLSATPHHSQDSIPLKREQSLTPSNEAPSQPHMTAPLPATTSFPSHSTVPQYPRLFPNLPPTAAPRVSPGVSTPLPSVSKQELTPDAVVKPEPELEPETEYQPRKHENLSTESQNDPSAPERGIPLAQLSTEETPERLEAGVQAGLKVLSELEVPLGEPGTDNEDAQTWLQHTERVRKEAVQTRTVVGVVGNTGAGKSSVINAMLDEERLVPTNCMRACTAVVTELSYNYSNIDTAKYRAEIEFIKPEEWRKELNVLFQEVF
ncbi:Putative P-loop containing nucleoside triphosphate hydrolase, dynamin [Septoria linicola]|uniref:P-loop containing nucleoside triphosphate hydrolase, dynamin n=1 Tax=Septoria linicola TaxID=215465 RepID=A0A9Q9EF17_9PEZI|nr:Putative P-loop containing nucleoside triphosphate hydrolase, dynamin [Septoria linicola]